MTTITMQNLKPGERLPHLIENHVVQRVLLALIAVNALTLGLETLPNLSPSQMAWLRLVDRAVLSVFVVEISVRIYAYRGRFFRDPWSVFDFAVIAIALVPASGPFSVLRALRVLRVLRVVTMVPSMRRVVGGLLAAIPGLASVAAVMVLLFYVFAVIATHLFGVAFSQWFGSVGHSLYTLFQIMTLESWSMGIARPVMEVFPMAWLFFVPFILVATFTMLNLFIGIIVSAIHRFAEEDPKETMASQSPVHIGESELLSEVRALRYEISELRAKWEHPAAERTLAGELNIEAVSIGRSQDARI